MNTRIQILRKNLAEKKLAAGLISSPENIGYFTHAFHFSAVEREAFLLVTQKNTYLFTDGRFSGMLRLEPHISFIETSARSGVYDEVETILEREKIENLGYEETNLTVAEYAVLKKVSRSHTKLFPMSRTLTQLRMLKDREEIRNIRKACHITDNAFKYIQPFIRQGVTELELADRLESFFKRSGATLAFPPIVAFGKNSAIPHHSPSDKKLLPTDHYILFDFGAKYNQYCADLSRTVFYGKISNAHRNQYEAVLEAQKQSLRALKDTERSGKSVDQAARTILAQHDFTIPHAVGHGLGLAIHESPSISPISTSQIIKDMVITIEPGIYIPHVGGIRIEDTVLVTESGYSLLTKSSKDVITIS